MYNITKTKLSQTLTTSNEEKNRSPAKKYWGRLIEYDGRTLQFLINLFLEDNDYKFFALPSCSMFTRQQRQIILRSLRKANPDGILTMCQTRKSANHPHGNLKDGWVFFNGVEEQCKEIFGDRFFSYWSERCGKNFRFHQIQVDNYTLDKNKKRYYFSHVWATLMKSDTPTLSPIVIHKPDTVKGQRALQDARELFKKFKTFYKTAKPTRGCCIGNDNYKTPKIINIVGKIVQITRKELFKKDEFSTDFFKEEVPKIKPLAANASMVYQTGPKDHWIDCFYCHNTILYQDGLEILTHLLKTHHDFFSFSQNLKKKLKHGKLLLVEIPRLLWNKVLSKAVMIGGIFLDKIKSLTQINTNTIDKSLKKVLLNWFYTCRIQDSYEIKYALQKSKALNDFREKSYKKINQSVAKYREKCIKRLLHSQEVTDRLVDKYKTLMIDKFLPRWEEQWHRKWLTKIKPSRDKMRRKRLLEKRQQQIYQN